MIDREPHEEDIAALRLSAMVDGELPSHEVDALCQDWRESVDARSRWHAYHMIGDALRSDELAGRGRDEVFVAAVRERLVLEPTQLAPSPSTTVPVAAPPGLARPVRRRLHAVWAPAGMAAGVALVAGAVWMSRPGQSGTDRLASETSVHTVRATAALASGTGAAATQFAPGMAQASPAQFDRYVSAHRQFRSTAAISPASGYLRDAVYESGAR